MSRYYSTSNNSQTVQDRAIVTTVDIQKVIHGLSNRAIFNDLEQPQTHISKSRHSLTLNISEMAKDTAGHIVRPTMKEEMVGAYSYAIYLCHFQ